MAANDDEIRFFDPHFHLFDNTNQVQDPAIFEEGMTAVWHMQHQMGDFGQVKNVKLTGATHIEVIPDNEKCILELMWVDEQLNSDKTDRDFWQAPKVDLSQSAEYVDLALSTMCHISKVTSIRHILNYEPSWPKNPENYLLNETWRENYKLLEKYNLAFDCQLNPHQFKDTVELFRATPNIKVVVNHLGTLKDLNNEEEMTQWREGMTNWSKLPNVYIKISMLFYTDAENWDKRDGLVHNLVKEVIGLFGAKRCMFASNWPCDKFVGGGMEASRLVDSWAMFSEGLSAEDKEWLYEKTARSVYTR